MPEEGERWQGEGWHPCWRAQAAGEADSGAEGEDAGRVQSSGAGAGGIEARALYCWLGSGHAQEAFDAELEQGRGHCF
ncbi:hypothetical protein CLOM_g20498 [Closterium sp. NIES-68]|nr:hypothetical protein CLOM_g20498 [Closterium sp. NIES-68]